MNIETLYQLDHTAAVQRLISFPPFDLVMEAASVAGEGWFLALVAVALALRACPDRSGARRTALRGLTVLVVTGTLVVVAKQLVHAPRPLALLGPGQVRVLLAPLREMSFPSGHSAASAALALWSSRDPAIRARRWPWIFAFLVGLSRVYVGAHWMTDVFAGWLLGLATAAAVCRAMTRPQVAAANRAATNEGAP